MTFFFLVHILQIHFFDTMCFPELEITKPMLKPLYAISNVCNQCFSDRNCLSFSCYLCQGINSFLALVEALYHHSETVALFVIVLH